MVQMLSSVHIYGGHQDVADVGSLCQFVYGIWHSKCSAKCCWKQFVFV